MLIAPEIRRASIFSDCQRIMPSVRPVSNLEPNANRNLRMLSKPVCFGQQLCSFVEPN